MIHLQRMTPDEFEIWAPRSRKEYADDKMKSNGYSQEEASQIADAAFSRYLPEGLRSANAHLYSIYQFDKRVGFMWFTLQKGDPDKAFLLDIIVEKEFRGEGLGRKAMSLLEDEVRKLGFKHIGLHVFGFNKPAIRLYESLGYATTDLVMEKQL